MPIATKCWATALVCSRPSYMTTYTNLRHYVHQGHATKLTMNTRTKQGNEHQIKVKSYVQVRIILNSQIQHQNN